ncbi:MAG: hypothetical protein ACWGO1_07165 [Anaerolineales bacterium]
MSSKSKRKSRQTATNVPDEQVVESPASYSRAADRNFNPDYSYVIKDLKRIGLLAGTFFAILIILSFIL